MYTHNIAFSIAAVSLLIVTILAVDHHGRHHRITAQSARTVTIDTPEQAYGIWQSNGVQGRILLLFDAYPHMKGLINYERTPQLTPSNFVEFSMFNNILRKIYLIVPDKTWDEFRQQKIIRPLRKAGGLGRGLYMGSLSGVPIIAVTPSSFDHMEEEPLVYINNRLFEESWVRALLSSKTISADITIIYQGDLR